MFLHLLRACAIELLIPPDLLVSLIMFTYFYAFPVLKYIHICTYTYTFLSIYGTETVKRVERSKIGKVRCKNVVIINKYLYIYSCMYVDLIEYNRHLATSSLYSFSISSSTFSTFPPYVDVSTRSLYPTSYRDRDRDGQPPSTRKLETGN